MKVFYSGAIPMEVLKSEQERITTEVASSETRLRKITIQVDQHGVVLKKAIKMALTCGMDYKESTPSTRRLHNQAFFTKILVKGNELDEGHFTDLFGEIFSDGSNNVNLVNLTGCYSNLSILEELEQTISGS